MENNIQYQRKRKAMLVVPLVIVAFATFGFAVVHTDKPAQPKPAGLNTELPAASFDPKEKPKDKMSFYDQARLDSSRQQSKNQNPIFKNENDPTVARINQKLAQINQQVSQPQPTVMPTPVVNNNKQADAQVARLEALMKGMKTQGPDPEMQQLSKMLSQIQAIQHPENVKHDTAKIIENPYKAIAAVIKGNQKITQGSAVCIQLNDSLIVKGQVIPKGTLAYGAANITNQRLLLEIKNITLDNTIIPVSLVVYVHGMPGIPAPEAELATAAGNGASNTVQGMQLLGMDQSFATQAAAGGIEAAKELVSKKVKKIKVHLKDGYPVLLRNNQIH